MTTIVLKDDEAALVFRTDGVSSYIPNMQDDDDVPEHVLACVATHVATQVLLNSDKDPRIVKIKHELFKII